MPYGTSPKSNANRHGMISAQVWFGHGVVVIFCTSYKSFVENTFKLSSNVRKKYQHEKMRDKQHKTNGTTKRPTMVRASSGASMATLTVNAPTDVLQWSGSRFAHKTRRVVTLSHLAKVRPSTRTHLTDFLFFSRGRVCAQVWFRWDPVWFV